jgi:signal transduction histidine kinase
MKLAHSNRFEANKWLVTARWFYAPAIFVMGLLSTLDPLSQSVFPVSVMIFLFSAFILTNTVFWRLTKRLEILNRQKDIYTLGVIQILTELIFFTVILHLAGGVNSVALIFFFIPIVSSIILFSPLGSLFIAFVSAFIVNTSILLEFLGIAQKIPGYVGRNVLEYDQFLILLSSTVIITAVYLIVGALAAYLSSTIKRKELELTESRRRSRLQSEKLKLLNEEYNNFARKLVRQQMELKKEEEKITELDREKGEFMATVAHQLRTPLSGIKWALNLLLEGSDKNLNSDQRALLLKAYENNERIIDLIQDMLGAQTDGSSSVDLSLTEVDVFNLLENTLSDFRSKVEEKNLKIEIQTEKNLPKLKADPQKIRSAFQNLIENAIRYSKKKGTVKIKIGKEKENFKVVIEDDGIGIPKLEQPNIFKKFFRAQNALRSDPEGSGLGLFIVRNIIKRHGGKISFESEENKGAKFTFTIPLQS